MKKKKLKLKELQVDSFVTNLKFEKGLTIKGRGGDTLDLECPGGTEDPTIASLCPSCSFCSVVVDTCITFPPDD